ncbi:MAG: DUF2155 domain-containing protein [Alphaproteobacteria bacterium]|nr:DUF2155 domain-containing protein [Alphaproteobacteria bacterium]
MKKTVKISALALSLIAVPQISSAAEIATNTAVMQAMDKITGQVSLIEVPVNTAVEFGTFSIVVRECKTRTPEEAPENFAFVDVVDKNTPEGDVNIFKGWMISSSPALNPVAHPVYDIWLLKCANKLQVPQSPMSAEELKQRDNMAMNRKKAKTAPITVISSDFEEDNLSGEPINLIPADVEAKSAAEKAQSEVISLNPNPENNAAEDNISAADGGEKNIAEEKIQEVKPQFVEEENVIIAPIEKQAFKPVSKEQTLEIPPQNIAPNESEQAIVDVPEAPKIADMPVQQADFEVIEDAPKSDTVSVSDSKSPAVAAIDKTTENGETKENEAPVADKTPQTESESSVDLSVSERVIWELEQELSLKAINEQVE